jgi:hypothetical protein
MAEMTPGLILLVLLTGGGLAGISSFATNWLNKKYDEQRHVRELTSAENRHLRELMFKIAIELWTKECDVKIQKVDWGHPDEIIVALEAYVVRMAKLMEVLKDDNVTKENIGAKLKEVIEVWKEAKKTIKA